MVAGMSKPKVHVVILVNSNHFRRKVIFLNTDNVPAPEARLGGVILNVIEANLCALVVTSSILSDLLRLFLVALNMTLPRKILVLSLLTDVKFDV